MPAFYEMVVSLEDLLGRLLVASERKISEYNEPDDGILLLGLPYPSEASNEDLNKLRPLYIELLQTENQQVLNRLNESEDQAILLLYFLEFPLSVRTCRADTTGISKCSNQEPFELTEIARRIIKNATLLSWCRNAISKEGRPRTRSILKSAVSILGSVMSKTSIIQEQTARKLIRRRIFQGEQDTEGFEKLRDDLADVVAPANLPHFQLVANSILLQTQILQTLYGRDRAMEMMVISPKKEVFEEALCSVKEKFSEGIFEVLRNQLGCPATPMGLHSASQVPYTNRDATKPVYVCGNTGCINKTTKRCNQCKLVGYCSTACQKQDWKAGHKKICNKKTTPKDQKVMASAEASRRVESPALLEQEILLKENPQCSYVIVLPSGQHDIGVQQPDIMQQLWFRKARFMAPQDPGAVRSMYEALLAGHPKQKEVIRKQLLAEYGVDPESEEARNADSVRLTEEDLAGIRSEIAKRR